jgi:GTP cyclohydrolase II/3,4-dihydroxy 2-butanone 4-phosphate synthase/GTP cyclohydrolase II
MTVALSAQRRTAKASPKLELFAEAPLPTRRGTFRTLVFREPATGAEHVALVLGKVDGPDGALVRVHSECLTGEVFESLKCDCRDQLDGALDRIADAKAGVLIYLRQEGRGIGLGNKIKAYALQARGADTYEANHQLGFADDLRRYDLAAEILRHLGVKKIDLLTNNPLKVDALRAEGIEIRSRLPSRGRVTAHNRRYLETKRRRNGHLIDHLDE